MSNKKYTLKFFVDTSGGGEVARGTLDHIKADPIDITGIWMNENPNRLHLTGTLPGGNTLRADVKEKKAGHAVKLKVTASGPKPYYKFNDKDFDLVVG